MRIHIDRIPEAGLRIVETRPPKWLTNFKDLGDEAIEDRVRIDITAERLGSQIHFEGDVAVKVKSVCARCAIPLETEIRAPVNVYFVPEKRRGKPEINDDDEGFETYKGEEIDIGEFLRGQLALYYPMRFLCRPDCKGLCPNCGADLNKEKCSCKTGPSDPRWAALKNIKL